MQRIIADLQIHSKYSRAVSQKMELPYISLWAAKKGIDLVATGDWTHPLWFREIVKNLKEVAPGIFEVKNPLPTQRRKARFILSTEISSIYKQGDRVRRIHNLIFSPSIETAEKVIKELKRRGCNLMSDGRPIVGLSSIEIAEIVFSIDEHALIIPAHIWTPWFSLFGSNSGFDSIKEAFGPFADKIYAIETGLSSDPIMNWQIKELDNRTILSFSDAHSLPKLGREATVFFLKNGKDFSFFDLEKAIKGEKGARLEVAYTIEFFPEEGKYHWSGHRNCGVKFSPDEVEKNGKTCPVCKKPLTIGVSDRVRQLSSRVFGEGDVIFKQNKNGVTFVIDKEKKRKPFVSLIPLIEILEEIEGSPAKAKKKYEELVDYAPEFEILLDKQIDEIAIVGGKKLAEAIKRVRERRVSLDPGYDGVFGKIKVFYEGEGGEVNNEEQKSQLQLF